MSNPNGGNDRSATQKELLQAQLAGQEQLYLTVARVEQKINEGLERVNLSILALAERMARVEGMRDAMTTGRTANTASIQLMVLTIGMIISLGIGIANFLVPH